MTPPVVLTIAGSDSGAGAGMQADLKTFAALGVYGVSVITAVTAQNTIGVSQVHTIPTEVVAAQLDAVLLDFDVAAVKVGMVGRRAIADLIVRRAGELPNLVVDPVLVATSGARLGEAAAVDGLVAYAKVLTPNREEARVLARGEGGTPEADAQVLARRGAEAVVVTGSETAVDLFRYRGVTERLAGAAVDTVNDHGTGCTFSSAIAARLAWGDGIPEAVTAAKKYVTTALHGGRAWRLGAGAGPLDHFS